MATEITLSSSAVKAFPAVGRTTEYADTAYLNTEANLTNILKSLYHNNDCSFIINESFTAPLKFVIYGYYFEISNISVLTPSNLWARIYIDNTTGVKQKLANTDGSKTSLDVNNQFCGVKFYNAAEKSSDSVTGFTAYDLQITDSSGNIVTNSKLYFSTIQLRNIDGNLLSQTFNTTSLTASTGSFTGTLNVKDITISGATTFASSAGSDTKFIYIDSDKHIKESTGTAGSITTPIYLNNGTLTAISAISLSGSNYLQQLTTDTINTTSITASTISSASITASTLSVSDSITFPAPVGSATIPIFINSNKQLEASSSTIGSNSQPLYMDKGEFKVVSTLSLSGSSSLGTLVNTTISNSCATYVGSTSGYAVYTTTSGKLTASSFTVSDPVASAQNLTMVNNTCSFNYIDTNSQDGKGKITTSKKYITITYGSTSNRSYLEIK